MVAQFDHKKGDDGILDTFSEQKVMSGFENSWCDLPDGHHGLAGGCL